MTEPESDSGASSSPAPLAAKAAATTNRAEEAAIVARAQKGDLVAYDELVRRYRSGFTPRCIT